ncbi:MAG: 50S ribosomal protein L1 [Lysobacterales bacterium]|jgi:large subunit ribosomal protein L1
MASSSKRNKAIREQIEPGKVYVVDDALELLKKFSNVKFKESVDVAIRLGVDPKKSDQNVRGATVLPNGTGKTVRVAVFTQGDNVQKALDAGADVVGMDDLHDQIKGGDLAFDVVIATPDAMRVVGKLGQVLGPRGLMPNPKVGTVATDVTEAVTNAKAGQVRFRTDKGGIIHSTIGKVDFEVEALHANLAALITDLIKLKPATAKGQYLKKVAVSTTMGPGLVVDHSAIRL